MCIRCRQCDICIFYSRLCSSDITVSIKYCSSCFFDGDQPENMGEQRGDGEEMETGNGRLGSWLGVRKRKRCGDEVETARKLERTGGNGQDSGKIAINNKTRTHPFLAGNFWPVKGESELQSCRRVRGAIPAELAGGQYIRNGGNSFFPPGQGQGYHL